ncbi:CAP domain-containing protein [Massilia glaciei]|uniref:CAP domain-containing protein n=1 Tax=Massilia glaciei TaxID=1524097 RepID=A0A2U2HNM8_9BURK|nr:CAP domain-containing protein [Massilia glaciei]PWF49107.1 CAP domain-containing protein [Massilia glaciei]
MITRTRTAFAPWLALAGLALCAPAHAQSRDKLVDLINEYRAAPGSCNGARAAPVAPLAPHPALGRVRVTSDTLLNHALERAGYRDAIAQAISISGARDTHYVMGELVRRYCKTLLSTQYSAIGASLSGDNWLIVLAQPAPPPVASRLPDLRAAGESVLAAVNLARASGRLCGEQHFAAAPALSWNPALAEAARAHSLDMARQRYFGHKGKDGREVSERAAQAGYLWRRIAENIALGQESPAEVVAGWLSSPGHCASIMHREFTEMGSAYGFDAALERPRIYWTQVFGTPR